MPDITLPIYTTDSSSRMRSQYMQMEPAVSGQVGPSGQLERAAQVGPAYLLELTGMNDLSDLDIRRLKETGQIECQTCKERTYQDRSDDPSVSFKAPGHISPESAAAMVQSHEQEHVANEQASARSEGRRVISQSVSISTSICPECGRTYVSGGETRTTTATDTTSQQEPELGAQVDVRA